MLCLKQRNLRDEPRGLTYPGGCGEESIFCLFQVQHCDVEVPLDMLLVMRIVLHVLRDELPIL